MSVGSGQMATPEKVALLLKTIQLNMENMVVPEV
jgi:hypothetical protein